MLKGDAGSCAQVRELRLRFKIRRLQRSSVRQNCKSILRYLATGEESGVRLVKSQEIKQKRWGEQLLTPGKTTFV